MTPGQAAYTAYRKYLESCGKTIRPLEDVKGVYSCAWEDAALAAQAMKPTPKPNDGGKTLGQIAFEAWMNAFESFMHSPPSWAAASQPQWETVAQAVLAAAPTEQISCDRCGKPVSSPVPVTTVVRAFVECPECIKSHPDAPKDAGAKPTPPTTPKSPGQVAYEFFRGKFGKGLSDWDNVRDDDNKHSTARTAWEEIGKYVNLPPPTPSLHICVGDDCLCGSVGPSVGLKEVATCGALIAELRNLEAARPIGDPSPLLMAIESLIREK